MDNVAKYFVASTLRAGRAYFRFYASIYVHLWNIPRKFDLRDSTLSIRSIEYLVTTTAISVSGIYILKLLWPQWNAAIEDTVIEPVTNMNYAYTLIWTFVHVLVVSSVIYSIGRVAKEDRAIWFRECMVLQIILSMIAMPISFVMTVAMSFFMLDSFRTGVGASLGITYSIFAIALFVILLRNIALLLQLRTAGTVVVGAVMLVCASLIQIVTIEVMQLFLEMPESSREIVSELGRAVGHWF